MYTQKSTIRPEPDGPDFEMPERDHKLKPETASFVVLQNKKGHPAWSGPISLIVSFFAVSSAFVSTLEASAQLHANAPSSMWQSPKAAQVCKRLKA